MMSGIQKDRNVEECGKWNNTVLPTNSRIYTIRKGDEMIYYAILERFNWSKRQETKMETLHPLVFQGTMLLHVDDAGNVTKIRTHRRVE